jgi:hypothetical protein
MNLKYLIKLKNQLVTATDFAPVMNYFMTEFGNESSFMRKGKHVRDERIEAAIKVVAKAVFPQADAIVIANIRLVEIAEHQFTHGGCFINGHFTSLFYFSDVQMGLMAMVRSLGGQTQLIRFSGKDASPNVNFSAN